MSGHGGTRNLNTCLRLQMRSVSPAAIAGVRCCHCLEVVQEVVREGFQMLGGLHQPAQHRVGIGLKDPNHGADTEILGQCPNGPHQLARINVLAVKQRANGLQKMSLAAQTH